MSGDSAEEKKHEPSQRRLDQLRRHGSTAQSQEFRTAIGFGGALVGLVVVGADIKARQLAVFDLALDAKSLSDPALLARLAARAGEVVGEASLVGLAGGLVYFLASFTEAGLIFAFDKLAPDFKKLNPSEGIKQKFGLQAGVDLARAVVKTVVLVSVCLALILWHGRELAHTPGASAPAAFALSVRLTLQLAVAAALLLLASGLLDLKLSRVLFNRRNRMTDKDVERERKEDFGSPEVRKHRREMRDELANAPKTAQMDELFLVVRSGAEAVALTNETPGEAPPRIIAFATGEALSALLATAQAKGVPVVDSDEAVQALKTGKRGQTAPPSSFMALGLAFRKAGLI